MEEKVKFDPGIGNLFIDFNDYINNLYSSLMMLRTIHQKRIKFKLNSQKIYKYMENNIAFYLGCLLWAYYIKENNIKSPKEIEGNVFLNMTDEQKEKYDYLLQVNFLENYFDSFERDTHYYAGKKINIPERWKNILKIYSDFLSLNNGFTDTKTTENIVIPDSLKNIDSNIDINSYIQKAIEQKNLEILMNIDNLPL